ncbi:hypothetical protein K501DRAFT_274048 [Backusella circina FSU 941]|nr:hypothetical protein K501DRAFT_274048 [Backusella circina FSU 941]
MSIKKFTLMKNYTQLYSERFPIHIKNRNHLLIYSTYSTLFYVTTRCNRLPLSPHSTHSNFYCGISSLLQTKDYYASSTTHQSINPFNGFNNLTGHPNISTTGSPISNVRVRDFLEAAYGCIVQEFTDVWRVKVVYEGVYYFSSNYVLFLKFNQKFHPRNIESKTLAIIIICSVKHFFAFVL